MRWTGRLRADLPGPGTGNADRKWRLTTRRIPIAYRVEGESEAPTDRVPANEEARGEHAIQGVGRVTEAPVADGAPAGGSEPAGTDELQAELQREQERHLRTRADFENYRRRVERDRDVAARQAKRELLLALVDLADGFDRALVHIDQSPDAVAAGLDGMQRRLSNVLEAEGVRSFESVGQPFDPTRHEAIATVRDFDGPSETVVDEAGRGYLWNDELLRPARVRVSE